MADPNLLIIHTDQQSWWTIGAYGGEIVETPNIDSLARDGALFTDFFTNTAVCTPSRGCFLTGRYPHCHGAYQNNLPLNRDEVTLAHVLREAGYETGYAGKWHLDGTPRPGWVHPARSMGFEDCRYMFNRGHWKKIREMPMRDTQPMVFPYDVIGDEETYTTDWLTSKAAEFLGQDRARPFFYMLSIPDPHGPEWVRPPYDERFRPEDMPLPDTFAQENLPDWAEEARRNGQFPLEDPEREDRLRRKMALYFGEVALIDDCVGRLLECLEEKGMLGDTIVVFTTDHGEYMGEHGLNAKNQLYETAHRIPLLIRWPQRIAPGTVVERISSTVDFQPSLLGLMGFEPCGREQGADVSAAITGDPCDCTEEAHIHHSSLERAGILTPEYQLAYVKDRDAVLFDRVNDPEQVRNLYRLADYDGVVRELTERIVRHHERVKSPARRWLADLL